MNNRVWFITGCTSGFGNILCKQLLARGEQVVATARNPERLSHLTLLVQNSPTQNPEQLLILKLDVTKNTEIKNAVADTLKKFGRIDVLINNAGYGATGALEEVSEAEIRRNFETNVFGLFEVTRAVLPTMRAQKSGHIINLSSVAGMVAKSGAGIYAATKFAVEGMSEALAGEVAPFNIKVSLIEPGGFRTNFAGSALSMAPPMKEYDESLAKIREMYRTIDGRQPGDPEKAVTAMIDLVDHPHPPFRLPMGTVALASIRSKLAQYEKDMLAWEKIIEGTDY